MTIRALNNTLKTSLENFDPFVVAHLVKFEKPQKVSQYGGTIKGIATDFTYITDGQYDISFNDGSTDVDGSSLGAQTYRANKVINIGTINESVKAKASNMTLVLDSAALGASASITATFTSTEMQGNVDLVAEGFQEGDKILISGSGSNAGKHIRIDRFSNGGKTVAYTAISSISTESSVAYTISLAAEELNVLLADKTSTTYTHYINREVSVYRAHLNPATGAVIGAPYLYFKGITTGASIEEKLESSRISWTLSSHWGDFVRIQGRLTDDSSHRALRADGSPDLDSVLKPAYASDLGFLHSNSAVNQLAKYIVKEKRYKMKKRGGIAGAIGLEKTVEYEVDVDRFVNLEFNPQAKMLPVVYGVRKVSSFPVFVDTDTQLSSTGSTIVYKADAICEGKIAGILDVHIEGTTTICLDKQDFDARSPSGASYNAETVKMNCYGRADRGDVLDGYDANTGSAQRFNFRSGGQGAFAESSQVARNLFETTYQNVSLNSSASGAATGAAATGILHGETHTITDPIDAVFSFYQGTDNQQADNMLVQKAANNQFVIQNNYYTDENPYWSPSHRLLDTAYVVGKYTIGEGETTIPEIDYVVRGRDPECFNYDGSYKHDDANYSSESAGNFALTDSVTIHKTSDDSQIGSALTIIDKWSSFDSDGASDHRFRFSSIPDLGTTTAFYMKNSSNQKWHMQTYDHSDSASNPGAALFNSGFSEAGGTVRGRKYTFSSPTAAFEFAVGHSTAIAGIWKSGNTDLLALSYSGLEYNSTSNVLDNLTSFSTTPGATRIYVKNAIQLASGASSTNDFYNGMTITLTDTSGTTPYVQKRQIVDYDGTTKVAMVDSPWDYNYTPKTTDDYAIGSIGDRRVTLNPAMQLLDYLTNERYGRGLDVDEDINLSTWQKAARDCDTRSDVTIAVPTSATIAVDEVWEFPKTGTAKQWQGTVKSVETLGGLKQVTFTNVVGKLGTKWNSYKTFASGELYWNAGKAYLGTGSVVATAPTSGHETVIGIGDRDSVNQINIDIAEVAANGNPLVKKYSAITTEYSASGYSLYDCDDVKYWRYMGWDDESQRNVTRHQMNQVVETTTPIFENINRMLDQFNGILRYSVGKYELEIKGQKGTVNSVEQISDEDIIGTIKLSDKGLKKSYNSCSTSIVDPQLKYGSRNVSFFNSDYLKEDKGVQKKGQFSMPGVTNYFNARFNVKQYLDESRFGLTIQFTMAPKGLLLTPGSIIELTYPRFGYTSKEFRISNLNFKKDGLVDIVAEEHNDNAFVVPAESGFGAGNVEQPQDGGELDILPVPARPTSLTSPSVKQGFVLLQWTQVNFNSDTHTVEIWRSSVNNFAASGADAPVLVGETKEAQFLDPITEGEGNQTRYYWIRYRVSVRSTLAGSPNRQVHSLFYPNTTDSGFGSGQGVTGIGTSSHAPRSIKINPGTTTNFVYQNDETGTESGYAANTALTTTKTNDAGTVAYVWKVDGVVQSGQVASGFTYTPTTNFSDMPQVVEVIMTDTVGSESFTASDSVTMTATKIVTNGTDGASGFTIVASNGTHNFAVGNDGAVSDVSSFSSTFTVRKGTQAFTYDDSSPYDANSYRYGSFANQSNVAAINTSGTLTISGSSGGLLSGTSALQGGFDVPVIDNSDGSTIGTFRFIITKTISGTVGSDGVRGGSIFTHEESTDGNITATTASQFSGTTTFTNTEAANVAAAVIAAASDSTIRPNDRITVTDNSANIAATRIYTGSAQTASGSVTTSNFSALVVETFDGSVIVDGTLSADKVAANATFSNNLTVGSTLTLNNSGKFTTTNKTSFTDNDAGFFLGYDSSAHKFNLGNATKFVKWDGTNLTVAGTITLDSSSTVSGTAASTVATAHQTAGGGSSGNNRTHVNSDGLVVVDGNGVTRVKIGDLSAL